MRKTKTRVKKGRKRLQRAGMEPNATRHQLTTFKEESERGEIFHQTSWNCKQKKARIKVNEMMGNLLNCNKLSCV